MKTRTLIKTIKSLGLTVDEYETYIVVKKLLYWCSKCFKKSYVSI